MLDLRQINTDSGLDQAAQAGMVRSGECTHCLRCVPICPEDSLSFDLRPFIRSHNARALE
jgi:ferredoxin-type protein NapH